MDARERQVFDQHVERVRASELLRRSHGLSRLFEYLAEASRRGIAPREADIAQDVFGRDQDLPGDASVRVYIHRLRRKLADFYAAGGDNTERLVMPLGEYRLELAAAEQEIGRPVTRPAVSRRRLAWALVALLLIAGNLTAWALVWRQAQPVRELAQLARTPLWSPITGERPVLVVAGDYYIFGDTGGGVQPERMVREYDVNTVQDLQDFLMTNPEFQGRYVDLDTYYTPVGATLALREILPLVRYMTGGRGVRVITSSQLTPEMLKSADIVYVGYFSALRLLEEPVFDRSRFRKGASYDELVDRASGASYVSSAINARGDQSNLDYGYLASFEGPAGNRFLVIAGTRDIGVMQAAEIATDITIQSDAPDPKATSNEALYEVGGVGRTNLTAKPVPPQP